MELLSPDEMKEALANDALCKQIGEVLRKAYPDRAWYVEVHNRGQSATIKVPMISMDWGMVVHLNGTITMNLQKCKMAGGELLERFKLARHRNDGMDILDLDLTYRGVRNAKNGELESK